MLAMAKKAKLPTDFNQKAKKLVGLLTDSDESMESKDEVKLAAAALGRLGGKKGGASKSKSIDG